MSDVSLKSLDEKQKAVIDYLIDKVKVSNAQAESAKAELNHQISIFARDLGIDFNNSLNGSSNWQYNENTGDFTEVKAPDSSPEIEEAEDV